jgi:hypothetical protein
MVELLNTAAAVDKHSTDLNIAAPPGESRRLPKVELLARGLQTFSASAPSVTRDLKLPDWERSDTLVFPRREALDPSLYAPRPFNVRYSEDWYKPGEEQRAAEAERQRRELAEADRARREFYGEIVPHEPEAEAAPRTNAAPPPAAE